MLCGWTNLQVCLYLASYLIVGSWCRHMLPHLPFLSQDNIAVQHKSGDVHALPHLVACTCEYPPPRYLKMSHHCHDEHAEGGGHHHHDGHDHSDDITPALQFSLYPHINFDRVTALNEEQPNSGRAVVKKTWTERLEEEPELASDADEQLIVNVP